MKKRGKKGQVWVETVVYTLIALAIIALVLAFVRPKIQEYQDKVKIETALESMRTLKSSIKDASIITGNIRIVEFQLKKGIFNILPNENKIEYVLEDSSYIYSEPDKEIDLSGINLKTEQDKTINIRIWFEFENIDLKYKNTEEKIILQEAPIPYDIKVENIGKENNKIKININVV